MRIGIDLGGTKTELIALDDAGTERHRVRVATPAASYDAIIACIRDLVLGAERTLGARCTVGVGTPGALSPATGRLRNANTVCLNGQPLDRDLSAALSREVRIANDANCFALSEATDGAGRGAEIVLGVILGTGCGGGVVVRGQLLQGASAIAGEWGHNPLPWPEPSELPGPACYCGKRGCIETFVSGPAVSRDLVAHGGDAIDVQEIASRASRGQTREQAALERFFARVSRGLASVINVIDPNVIVLGGGLSQLSGIEEAIAARLPAHVFSDYVATKIVRALRGDSSGVRGAAWLFGPGERSSA
jgi:fructokinase